jgi:hypothetical protein
VADTSSRRKEAQCVRALRHARQRLGMVRGHLAFELSWRTQ